MSDVEAIVLDWDGGEMLARCLGSIASQRETPRRVIVWDNGSREPVSRRLPRFPSLDVEIHRSERNLGFTGGINRAMELVDAPFVAWINNDVVLEPDWLLRVRRLFDDERLGAAQCVNRSETDKIDGAGIGIFDGIFGQLHHGERIEAVRSLRPAWGVSATAALYRTAALRQVAVKGHALHPDFFAYCEDIELCARLKEAGWRMTVIPELLATHEGSRSGRRLNRLRVRLRVRNRYFVNRLHPRVGSRSALLREDAQRVIRRLSRGHLVESVTVMLAVIEGLARPINR